jgi:hypothetical protein
MGIREKLKDNPKVGIGVAVGVLVLGVGAMVAQLSNGGLGGGRAGRAFFTTDDGATWFVGDASQIPPFLHDGKQAVRAYVFECGGKRFVNHLERFTPERRKLAEAALEAEKAGKSPPRPPAAAGQTVNWGVEVKKPGDKEWLAAGNLAKAARLMQAKCPDGHGEALPVQP